MMHNLWLPMASCNERTSRWHKGQKFNFDGVVVNHYLVQVVVVAAVRIRLALALLLLFLLLLALFRFLGFRFPFFLIENRKLLH